MPLPERSTVSVPAPLFQRNSFWSHLNGYGCSHARKAQAAVCVFALGMQALACLHFCCIDFKLWLRGRIVIFLTCLFPTACVPLLIYTHPATWVEGGPLNRSLDGFQGPRVSC